MNIDAKLVHSAPRESGTHKYSHECARIIDPLGLSFSVNHFTHALINPVDSFMITSPPYSLLLRRRRRRRMNISPVNLVVQQHECANSA